jgi:hypothetical protein
MATKTNPTSSKRQGYWEGQVDTILKGLEIRMEEIRDGQKTYIHDNLMQHEAIKKSIDCLRMKAARWGGIAGIVAAIASVLAIALFYHLTGMKM